MIPRTVLAMTDTLNGRAAANIRAQLGARRMTHAQLGEQAGLSRQTITAICRESQKITLTHLELIAEALEVEPAKLLND